MILVLGKVRYMKLAVRISQHRGLLPLLCQRAYPHSLLPLLAVVGEVVVLTVRAIGGRVRRAEAVDT
jgi:hypothetical protein